MNSVMMEMKKKKMDLEEKMCKMMMDFEKETGMRINYVSMMREQDKKKGNDPESVMPIMTKTKDMKMVTLDVGMGD